MASLNLSSNGPSISKSYQSVVNAPPPTGSAAGSPSYGQWAVFSVSTPLVNVFQQDSGNKESVLKVQSTGEGELIDLIDEFSEGRVQFAYVKVKDPNTGLPKNVLIAWCGEGVPERTKGYFTSHLAAVSKFLHGYHVQITARSDRDLTPEGIIQKVADASGAKYSAATEPPPSINVASKPPVASKPVFTPKRTDGVSFNPTSVPRNVPKTESSNAEDDGWGPDAPPVTRTELEKVQPAYKPTKVDIQALKSERQSPAQINNERATEDRGDVVKGGYQPIGKVDIAAIRRQAREAGELKNDRPEPVKGTYEPVGKVDIAAIRAKAQKPSDAATPAGLPPRAATGPQSSDAPASISVQSAAFNPSERLTSLPKPKVSNKFGTSPSFTGTKPPLPSGLGSQAPPSAAQVGIASRTFADEGGKTPAQLWAEKKAKERGLSGPASSSGVESPIQSQPSGSGEWKSSYTGKTWAPVQTSHTGRSVGSNVSQQHAGSLTEEKSEFETQPQKSVSTIREQLANEVRDVPSPTEEKAASNEPSAARSIPLPGLPSGPTEPETDYESESKQTVPSPPPQPRSPTPPTPPAASEASPIRIAMPVSRGVADAHSEQRSPPPAMPVESLQEVVPDERDIEEPTHDMGRATAAATSNDVTQAVGPRALVQYDYEKAEENEIELREGEYVTDIEMVDKDWWLGLNAHGERGLFPSNYVELIEDDQQPQSTVDAPSHEREPPAPVSAAGPHVPPEPNAAAASKGPAATALYDYEAGEDNELSFPEGAKIVNIEFPDNDWWFGEFNGQSGLFPANYVQLDK